MRISARPKYVFSALFLRLLYVDDMISPNGDFDIVTVTTCFWSITCEAERRFGKDAPSSEANIFKGESVPDVKITLWTNWEIGLNTTAGFKQIIFNWSFIPSLSFSNW